MFRDGYVSPVLETVTFLCHIALADLLLRYLFCFHGFSVVDICDSGYELDDTDSLALGIQGCGSLFLNGKYSMLDTYS